MQKDDLNSVLEKLTFHLFNFTPNSNTYTAISSKESISTGTIVVIVVILVVIVAIIVGIVLHCYCHERNETFQFEVDGKS